MQQYTMFIIEQFVKQIIHSLQKFVQSIWNSGTILRSYTVFYRCTMQKRTEKPVISLSNKELFEVFVSAVHNSAMSIQ